MYRQWIAAMLLMSAPLMADVAFDADSSYKCCQPGPQGPEGPRGHKGKDGKDGKDGRVICCKIPEKKQDRFGYFYTECQNELCDCRPVEWSSCNSVHSSGVFLDPNDCTQVVIAHPGFYLANYIVTATLPCGSCDFQGKSKANESSNQAIRFILKLNQCEVKGSAYADQGLCCQTFGGNKPKGTISTFPLVMQDSGQAVFFVFEEYSRLQLVNKSCQTVILVNSVSCCKNVSASLFVWKIGDFKAAP